MMLKLSCIILVSMAVSALAAEPATIRPKNCAVGTTYKKECNTCTCGADESKDKCSQIDCKRASSSTTTRPKSNVRPGTCPTKVTPAPGSTDCSKRTQTSECKVDTDCGQAKKCCENGCGILLCRNAIYNYS